MKYKQKITKAPTVIVRNAGRGVTPREAFEKAQVGFEPAYQKKWVEKVSIPGKTKYFDYDKVFGKKKAI